MTVRRRLAATLLPLLALVPACSDGSPTAAPTARLTARPVPSPTASPTGTAPATPSATAAAVDAERDRFVSGYAPPGAQDLTHATVELDGDDDVEVVFGYVAGERARVDLADWTGDRYEVAASEVGGNADELVALEVGDLTGDDQAEVATIQRVGASGHSASVWSVTAAGGLAPLNAVGDCFEGANTYGDTGVVIADRDGDGAHEIRAVCEDPDLPQPLWPTVVYVWSDGAYRCDHRVLPDGGQEPCR